MVLSSIHPYKITISFQRIIILCFNSKLMNNRRYYKIFIKYVYIIALKKMLTVFELFIDMLIFNFIFRFFSLITYM